MATRITNNDIIRAANTLGCSVAAIRAVDDVESNGRGFTSSGELVLRFETKWFSSYTGVTISGSGRSAYQAAYARNPRAAMLSSSWGRYQIMGFNYELCGYSSVESFVAAMQSGEAAQLRAFVAFVQAKNLVDELRRLDWAGFAYIYNGANYRQNDYDGKLARAYAKYKDVILSPTDDVLVSPITVAQIMLMLAVLVALGGVCYYLYTGQLQRIWSKTRNRIIYGTGSARVSGSR